MTATDKLKDLAGFVSVVSLSLMIGFACGFLYAQRLVESFTSVHAH